MPTAGMAHILLIDDDDALVPEQVRRAFPADEVVVAGTGARGIAAARARLPDVVLLDLHLPDGSGLEIYEQLRALDARLVVIFITMAKTADDAILAMKQGAFNYLYKPLDLTLLRRVVGEGVEVAQRMRVPVALNDTALERDSGGALLGSSPAMLEIYKAIGRVSAQDVTVLITGESGTGKELVARAIYQHGARARAPFMALNCAAIPENLLESELFGHERGAFTGADRRRIGKFEQCSGGTLLLDEIGDMPLALQAKILRLLQGQTFERLGGNESIHTDVRVLASTHRELREPRFRADLFYRLGVFTIQLPPLRERPSDLPLLVSHYVRLYARELGRDIREIAPETLERLAAYSWPGNIRELTSVLKQALLHASGVVLLPGFLPPLGLREGAPVSVAVPSEREPAPPSSAVPTAAPAPASSPSGFDLEAFIRQQLGPGTQDLYAETHRQVDRLLLSLSLEFTKGNHRQAARLLGIARQTMRVKLRALGIGGASSAAWLGADDEDVPPSDAPLD